MILGIYGAGALGREVLEIALDIQNVSARWDRFVYLADNAGDTQKDGIEIVSPEEFAGLEEESEVVIAVGEPFSREKMLKKAKELSINIAMPLIHPSSRVVKDTKIGRGTVIAYGCCISFSVDIGENVYLQPGCGAGHNVVIGNNSVISAGVRIAGYVHVGENTYIGLTVPVRDRVTIGKGCIVSMGSVVQRDIPDNVIAMGNPARAIKPNIEHKLFG